MDHIRELELSEMEGATGGLSWKDKESLRQIVRNSKSAHFTYSQFIVWLQDHYHNLPISWVEDAIEFVNEIW